MPLTENLKTKSWHQEFTPSLMVKSMFYYVQSVGYEFFDPDDYTERKGYNSFVILYTKSGKGLVRYRNQSYEATPGKLMVINCMEQHYYTSDMNDIWEVYWLHFNGCESGNYVENILRDNGPLVELDESSVIPGYIIKIAELMKEIDSKSYILSSLLIAEILTELMLGKYVSVSDNKVIPPIIQNSITKIEDYYSEHIDMETLAESMGISKYYLSRLFKKHTGYSPYEYLIKYRLNQGKILLKTTDMPICEIAQKVGFENTSHFIKIFKTHEDTTPLKFRSFWKHDLSKQNPFR